MNVSQNANTAGRRLWFRRFAGVSCVLLITTIAAACVVLTSEKLRFAALRHLARHGMLSGEYSKALDEDILTEGRMSYDLITTGDIYDHKAVMRRVWYFVESHDPNVSKRANDIGQRLLSLHLNRTSEIRLFALTLAYSSAFLSATNSEQLSRFLSEGDASEQIAAFRALWPITKKSDFVEEQINRMLASDDNMLVEECLKILAVHRNRPNVHQITIEGLLVSTNKMINKLSEKIFISNKLHAPVEFDTPTKARGVPQK